MFSEKTIARFWSYVDMKGEKECWNWIGGTSYGYGSFRITICKGNGKSVIASRYSLALKLEREVSKGMDACHTCHNRLCVNPNHLYEGTRKQNMIDKIIDGTHPIGEKNHRHILTDEDVKKILCDNNNNNTQIAKKYNVHRHTISDIKLGKSWKHISRE